MPVLITDKDPGSYFIMDPGRKMGFASCFAGGEKLKSGTWKFQEKQAGDAYETFIRYFKTQVSVLPDVQVGIEMLTFVKHGPEGNLDPNQIAFSAGWQALATALCATMGLRPLHVFAIGTWRSRSHGKTRVPKGMEKQPQPVRTAWLKMQAKAHCDSQGWKYGSEDEAEALCMLEALRVEYEPGLAFNKGKSYLQQQSML